VTAPLTTEDACELAQFRASGGALRRDVEARLFAWVRAELTNAPVDRAIGRRVQYLSQRLGLKYSEADALRKAAGWPS